MKCDSNSLIFSGLESLTLTECNIRTFSGQIFSHSPNVRDLSLNHNGLPHLDLDGRNLPRLENLDVKFNRLDDSFFLNPRLKFHQLETWNISHNRVKNLTHVFKLLSLSPSLANIDIRKMSQIPLKHNIFLSSSGPIVNVKSKLGPEIRSVMAWPTTTTHHHPPHNFFGAINC